MIKHMRLKHMVRTYIQTMQQPSEGTVYVHSSDGFFATYLKGQNVVVIEATSLDQSISVKGILQVDQFNTLVNKVTLKGDERGQEAIFPLWYHAPKEWGMVITRDDR